MAETRRAAYQYLPTAILDQQARVATAEEWARKQTADIAQRWADLHVQDALDSLGSLITPQQALPPAPMATGPEGDRPASEFDQPAMQPFPEPAPATDYSAPLAPPDAGPPQPSAFNTLSQPDQLTAPAVPDPTSGPFTNDPVGWGATAVEHRLGEFAADQETLSRLSLERARAAHRGEHLSPEDEQKLADLSSQYGLALTGEPIANVGGGGIGPDLVAHLRSAGLTEDAARLLMDQVAAYPEMPPALYARVERLTAGLPEEAANAVWAGLDRYRLERQFGVGVGRGGAQPTGLAAEPSPLPQPPITSPEPFPTAEPLSSPAEVRSGGPPIESPSDQAPPAGGGGPPSTPSSSTPSAEVARLRLDKFPEGVRDTIAQAAQDANFWRTQRRGVIPDAQAEQMADSLGRTVDQVIARGKAGKAYTTEETRAIRNAVVAQATKVNDLAAEIAQAPTKVNPEMVAQQVAEGLKLADLTRVAEGARAEAGRTLRAYQAFARDYAADPASAVQRIYRATGLTPQQATEAVNQFTKLTEQGADPFQLASFWAKVERPPVKAEDWFRLIRYNAMLSGPRTLLVNVLTVPTEAGWRLGRDTAASIATGQSGPTPQLQGMGAGFVKGLAAAREILAHGITQEQALAGDVPRSVSSRLDNPVAKGIATTLEFNGRIMAATDELARQMFYGMAKGREAGITASKEGLTGQAWLKRVDDLMADARPSEGALAVADRSVFHGPMGYLGEKVLAPLQGWSPMGVPVGNVVLPFLRTVYHITARGVDRSPLGAVGTLADAARGTYGNVNPLKAAGRANLREQLGKMEGPAPGVAPLGERTGDALMGSIAFAGLGLAAAQGNISGKGPSDPEKRKMLQAEGWQPYSVRINGNWVSYTNWGPMAIPLSLAAALHEGEGKTPLAEAYDVFERGANVLTEQSYLQGVGAIFKAMDPNSGATFGERQLEGFLNTLVPFGAAINTVGQATDPVLRQPEKGDVAGAVQARLPGAREALPAQQDVLGRDVANPQQGLGAVLPVRASPERPSSVLRALREANVDIPEPPKTISNGDVKNLPLTAAEQRAYRTAAGRELSAYVEAYLASDKAATDSPARRAAVLKAYLDAARQKAEAEVLRGMGKDQLRERVRAQGRPAA